MITFITFLAMATFCMYKLMAMAIRNPQITKLAVNRIWK
jgi:hypothetical protein